jgi:hypothetical protein
MSITASLLFAATAAALGASSEAPKPANSRPSIAAQATATVRIMEATQIRFVNGEVSGEIIGKAPAQIRRDTSGTVWVEFS